MTTKHPEAFGRFKVTALLGGGGMGRVYKAFDPSLQRDVAIKVLYSDVPEHNRRLSREAIIAARLRHTNIVPVFDVELDREPMYIVMDYVRGTTLADTIRASGERPSLECRLTWMIELCSGLAAAHGQNIRHLDIKPSNLIVDGEGTLRILDFGIARFEEDPVTSWHVAGSPGYIAPERFNGQPPDGRSDLFSAGVVLYELLTFTRAFPGDYHEARAKVCQDAPVPISTLLPDLDPAVAGILARALEKDPTKRYQSAEEMGRALTRARQLATPEASITRRRDMGRERVASSRQALREGRLEQARIAAKEALALLPGDPDALDAFAEAMAAFECRDKVAESKDRLQRNDGEGARQAAVKALNWSPDNVEAQTALEVAEAFLCIESASRNFSEGQRHDALRQLREFTPFWRVREAHTGLVVRAAVLAVEGVERAVADAGEKLKGGDLAEARAAIDAAALAGAPVAIVHQLLASVAENEVSQSVQAFLTAYEQCLAARDTSMIKALWPSIPPEELDRLNRQPQGIQFTMEGLKLTGGGQMDVEGRERASGRPPRRAKLTLERHGDSWILKRIQRY